MQARTRAKFVERLPLKLVIIDESIVMFGMDDPVANSDAVTIVVVEHPALAMTLKLAFEVTWSRGLTFEEAAPRAPRDCGAPFAAPAPTHRRQQPPTAS